MSVHTLRWPTRDLPSAAAFADAIAPIVADYWQRRLVEVEAGSVTVTERRG